MEFVDTNYPWYGGAIVWKIYIPLRIYPSIEVTSIHIRQSPGHWGLVAYRGAISRKQPTSTSFLRHYASAILYSIVLEEGVDSGRPPESTLGYIVEVNQNLPGYQIKRVGGDGCMFFSEFTLGNFTFPPPLTMDNKQYKFAKKCQIFINSSLIM